MERYDLEEIIGRGSMGEVWRATDTLLNRSIAIKYLSTPEQSVHRDLFLAEARMLARLKHPGIVTLYDASFDDKCFLVMEYAAGQTLADILKDGPLGIDRGLDIALKILEALRYAHAQGVVHRDIKPDNVLIDGDEVKLADFGFSNLVALLKEGTEYRVGTPAYMSPEQIQGKSTDERSDLYSFGVMLFEMLTGGCLPFDVEGVNELFAAHLLREPLPISRYVPDIPPVLEQAVKRLLSKMLADRYPSAEALLNVLEAVRSRRKFSRSYLSLLPAGGLKSIFGRDQEMADLIKTWQRVTGSSKPEMVIIGGGAGMGKSRLAAEFLGKIADQGYPVLIGRAGQYGLPYSPYSDVLGTIIQSRPELVAVVDNPGCLVAQLPGLSSYLPETGEEYTFNSPEQARWEFFEAVLALMSRLGPAVIFLENAQYLDESSMALSRFLLERGQSILLVAACRDDEEGCPDVPAARRLTLAPLTKTAGEQYLAELLGGPVDAATAKLLLKQAGGNPFFIEQMVRYLLEAGKWQREKDGQWRLKSRQVRLPPVLIDLLRQRVNRLSDESRRALAAAAIIGPVFDFQTWVAVLEKAEVALAALDEALERRILLSLDNERYAFAPAELTRLLADDLTLIRRKCLHRQLVPLLTDPAELAYHCEQGGLPADAAEYWGQAGDMAAAACAFDQAITYWQRAVTKKETAAAYAALGDLYRQKGDFTRAIESFRQALHLAEDTPMQARALNGLAFVYWLYDHYQKAHQHAKRVLLLPGCPPEEEATARSHLGMICWLAGRLDEAGMWCRKAVDSLAESEDKAGLAGAYNRLGLVYLSQSRLDDAARLFEQSLSIRRGLNDLWGQAYCINNLGKVAIERGQFTRADSRLDQAQQIFNQIGSRDGLMVVFTNKGRSRLRQGRPAEALNWLRRALRLALDIGKQRSYGLGDIYLLMAEAELELGRRQPAANLLAEGLRLVEAAGNLEYVRRGQALARLAEELERLEKENDPV